MSKNRTVYSGELARPVRHIPYRQVVTLGLLASGQPDAILRAQQDEVRRVNAARADALMQL